MPKHPWHGGLADELFQSFYFLNQRFLERLVVRGVLLGVQGIGGEQGDAFQNDAVHLVQQAGFPDGRSYMTGTFQREPAFRTAFLVLAHAVFHGAGSGPDFRRGDVQDFFPESGGYLFSVLAFAASDAAQDERHACGIGVSVW